MSQDMQEQQRRAQRIETLIQEVATFPDPHARATTEELIQALLDMYGEGLSRLLELTAQTEASGLALIDTFAKDDLLASLFMLHDIHPIDIETRIANALVEVRPYLKSHGGNVELVRVEDGVAYLRLEGSCHGCPGSTMTLKLAIEDAIYKAAPDLLDLKVEGVTDPPPRPGTPITFVPRRQKENTTTPQQNGKGGWTVVEGLESLHDGILKQVTVQGESLLFCQIAGTYYAYHNQCTNCNTALTGGRLEKTTLICPSCEKQYDITRAGRCLDTPNLFLEPTPLLMEGSKVKVTLSAMTKEDQFSPLSAPVS